MILSRRHFLMSAGAAITASAQPAPRRNVLFIAADDLNCCFSTLRPPDRPHAEPRRHRPTRCSLRPLVLPVRAVQPVPKLGHDRTGAGHHGRLRPPAALPRESAERRHARSGVPEERLLRRARRQDLPLRQSRPDRHRTGSTTSPRGIAASTRRASTKQKKSRWSPTTRRLARVSAAPPRSTRRPLRTSSIPMGWSPPRSSG